MIQSRLKFAALLSAGLLSFGVSADAHGQPPFEREVDVSRDYVPDMGAAPRLDVHPAAADTTLLRPEFDYSIRPEAWGEAFSVDALGAENVSAPGGGGYPFTLRVGGGFPGQSLLDVSYYGLSGSGVGYGAWLNHYGRYNRLRNDLGLKKRATETGNSIGVYASVPVSHSVTLSGEAGFDYDLRSRYGLWMWQGEYAQPLLPELMKSTLQSHATPHARFVIGNDFTDLSYINWRAGVDGYHIQDRDDAREGGFGLFADAARTFGVQTLRLNLSVRDRWGSHGLDAVTNELWLMGLRYELELGRLEVGFGADAAADYDGDSYTWFLLPKAYARLDLGGDGRAVLYATLDSRMEDNGMRSLVARDPYFSSSARFWGRYSWYDALDPMCTNARHYELRGGMSGNIAGAFSYNLFAGGLRVKDAAALATFFNKFYPLSLGTVGVVPYRQYEAFTAGAEIEARISPAISAGAKVRYCDYDVKKSRAFDLRDGQINLTPNFVPGVPEYEGEVYAKYERDKLYVRVSAGFTGKRTFLEVLNIAGPIGDAEDGGTPERGDDEFRVNGQRHGSVLTLGFEAEYRLKPELGIFLEGENLTDRKLYPYNHYRGHGVSITAGVKFSF